VSRVRANRMPGSMGGSWRRSQLRLLITAALGKPRDLSPATPTAGHLASSLPDQPLDECHLFLCPIVVGGGKRALPDNVRAQLKLLDERRFRNGVVHLHYSVCV
jgi:hypothetical protein